MESETQKKIIQYLKIKHIFHFRNNSGVAKTARGGFIRYGCVGSPDIICVVKGGRFLGIECKEKSKQSKEQKEFQENLEKSGGIYLLAYSLEDVVQCLKSLQ